ncbi:hypothetical protein CPC16_001799 [Podila verticillata]|nr:hypothetical protein CPC16_001799 [Podila verticillata]
MAFAVAMEDPEGFKQYLTTLIITAASVAWLFLLLVRPVDLKLTKYRRLFNVAMTLQLLFATSRNLPTLLLSSDYAMPCKLIAVVGGALYPVSDMSGNQEVLLALK